MKSNRVKPILV